MALSAVKALEKAAGYLENIEKAIDVSDEKRAPVEVIAALANAYAHYAMAYTLVHQHVEVRTGGGGI